ncbi:hypothetical protein ACQ4PT_062896 [Festuca glaucescens]
METTPYFIWPAQASFAAASDAMAGFGFSAQEESPALAMTTGSMDMAPLQAPELSKAVARPRLHRQASSGLGRQQGASSGGGTPKKPPQRGLGVAELERLRCGGVDPLQGHNDSISLAAAAAEAHFQAHWSALYAPARQDPAQAVCAGDWRSPWSSPSSSSATSTPPSSPPFSDRYRLLRGSSPPPTASTAESVPLSPLSPTATAAPRRHSPPLRWPARLTWRHSWRSSRPSPSRLIGFVEAFLRSSLSPPLAPKATPSSSTTTRTTCRRSTPPPACGTTRLSSF